MKRHDVKPSSDKKHFARTAAKSKDINLRPFTYRGGIRL